MLEILQSLDATQTSNGGKATLDESLPYMAHISVQGCAPLLFHGWNNESVAEKGKSAKGSKAKKTDDIESYVYRNDAGYLGIPGKNFYASIVEAGRYVQDPRSPRKSARDLCRAGIVPMTVIAIFEPHTKDWDYLDKQRVTVQRNGITRTRPAMREGWKVTFDLLINLPEYISQPLLSKLVVDAGRLCGVCDFRPTYGRFSMTQFKIMDI